MTTWTAEIQELEGFNKSLSGQLPELEKELERLIIADDENIALLYSRRCLEVIVNDLCESELNRPRKSEPLKGVIDRLNKEEKIPSHIITSMQNLNSLSVYGTHPKEFDPRQVKPVLINLATVVEWYMKYKGIDTRSVSGSGSEAGLESGSEKKENTETLKSQEQALIGQKGSSRKRNITILGSLLVILLIFVLVFDVFNLISKDKFTEIRDPDGKISIAVIPFENLTGDSSLNFWQSGISEFLINDLGNSEELSVLSSQVISEVLETKGEIRTLSVSPAVARDVARKIRAGTHITGNYLGAEDNVSIMVNLVNTDNGALIWSSKVDGALVSGQYRHLLDSLSDLVRNFLELRAMEKQANEDFLNAYPNSAEAYRYYIDGLHAIVVLDYETAIELLLKAIEIDPDFTFAAFYLAWAYNNQGPQEETCRWTQEAFSLKNNLPSKYHNWIDLWYACCISDNEDNIRKYCNLLEKSGINSRFFWYDLGVTYQTVLIEYDKAVLAFEKVDELNRQWGNDWNYLPYYNNYSKALSLAGRPEEVFKIIEKGLQINPASNAMILNKIPANVLLGDTVAVEKNILEYWTNSTASDSRKEFWIGRMYSTGKDTVNAVKHFRKAYDLDPEDINNYAYLTYFSLKSDKYLDEGLGMADIGLNKWPENEFSFWIKGLALHKSGKHKEGLEYLRKAEERAIGYNYWLEQDIDEIEQALAKAEGNESDTN